MKMRLLVIWVMAFMAACDSRSSTESASIPRTPRIYTTSFPLTEDPISENKLWINGGETGLDWTNVRTIPGLAFGTQTGSGGFSDSIAILSGAWGPDQTVTATVHTVNQRTGSVFEEVEMLLRFRIAAHVARGYEVNFRALNSGESYSEVVRWNGSLGNFTYLAKRNGPQFGISEGSIVTASIRRNVITVYLNGVQINQVVDNAFQDGNPGIGFFLDHAKGTNADYGFSSFTATDGMTVAQVKP